MNEKPTDLVAAWLTAHQKVFGSEPVQFTRREGTLVVQFETPKCFIEILVWDFGCFDIHVLNKSTGAYDYTVGGYFDGVAGLTERLDTFLAWFTSRNAS